jgi:hypothetical protein
MSRQRMDADTAETLAGVVRLLRRAAELVWAGVDAERAGSPRQVLGLGIDLAADEVRNLVPDAISVDGPVPVGDEPASLLRSAEQLLRRVTTPGARTGVACPAGAGGRPGVGGEDNGAQAPASPPGSSTSPANGPLMPVTTDCAAQREASDGIWETADDII